MRALLLAGLLGCGCAPMSPLFELPAVDDARSYLVAPYAAADYAFVVAVDAASDPGELLELERGEHAEEPIDVLVSPCELEQLGLSRGRYVADVAGRSLELSRCVFELSPGPAVRLPELPEAARRFRISRGEASCAELESSCE